MSKANFGEGAVIEIPDGLVNELGKFDRYLESIARSSKAINASGFQALMTALNGMKTGNVESLERFAQALEKLGKTNVGTVAQNVAQGVNSVGSAAQKTSGQIGTMNTSLSQAGQLLNQLTASRPFQNLNITQLSDQISNIKTMLGRQGKDIKVDGDVVGQYPTFSKAEQQALVNKQRLMEQELKIQQTAESQKAASIARVAKAQNEDVLNQQKNDEKALQSHLKAMEQRTAAAQAQSAKLRQIGEQEVQETIKNAQRTRQAQTTVPSVAAGSSAAAYLRINEQVAQLEQRQQSLNKTVKEYELTMQRIQSGKGGHYTTAQQQEAEAARQELEANKQAITALRQKQQAIVDANMAYQQSKQMVESLKVAEQQRNSIPNQRSQQTLAEMRKYYTELERSSAQAAAQAERDAQKKQAAEEKAAQAAQKAWEKAAAQTQKYASQYHNQRQGELSSTFATQNTTARMALAESKNAKTYREEVAAIELLKQARLNLNSSTQEGKMQLMQLNAAIKKHEESLRRAGIQSGQLAGKHRNLMDISGQLARQLALMFSVSQVEGYINQVAKIRGEFELQQRSLEAILQNKTQADALFQKTVDLAIKSPFSIRQLVSYTKQLAAYRIEGDKLYDTTKRLADVSAGLGVDMQRLILAYGQVKAAAYLRGTEVRQFTEAGVNMYGELQSYFQEVKGEAYTTAQIVDMISKRKVTFEDVEAVFQRLTSQGGLFYNMQEIQSETLQGKIMNLKDSIDVMLNSIGKSNEWALKGVVDSARVAAEHWETISHFVIALSGVMGALVLRGVAFKVASSQIGASWGAMLVKMKAANSLMGKMKAFMSTGWGAGVWGLGIGVAIDLIGNWTNKMIAAKEATAELNKTLAANRANIDLIGYKFENAKAGDGQSLFDVQKALLSKLQSEAESQNIHIASELDDVTEENIQEVFRRAQERIRNIQTSAGYLKRQLNKNYGKEDQEYVGGMSDELVTIQGAIDETANRYYLAYQKEIDLKKQLLADSATLSETERKSAQERIKELEERQRKLLEVKQTEITSNNASIDAYFAKYNALKSAISELRATGGTDAYGETVFESFIPGIEEGGKNMNVWQDTGLADLEMKIRGLTGKLAEFGNVWREQVQHVLDSRPDLMESILHGDAKDAENAKNELRNILENAVAGEEWTEPARLSFFKAVESMNALANINFKVRIDTDGAKTQAESLSKYLSNYFDSQQFMVKVGIKYEDLGQKDLGKDILDEAKGLDAAAERAREIAGMLNGKTWKGGKVNNTQVGISSELWNTWFGSYNASVDTADVRRKLLEYANANDTAAGEMGYQSKKDKADAKKRANAAAKAERDIWSERIAVLKEMQGRYESVKELMGDDAAAGNVRAAYSEALANVKMGEVMKAEDIVPTKEGMVKALEKVLGAMPKTMKDYFKKSQDLKKSIAELKIEIDKEKLEQSLKEAKEMVEEAFTGLDLYKKLKDAGLGDSIIEQMFPNISKDFDAVQASITAAYAEKFPQGEYLEEGTKQYEQYHDELRNLDKKRVQDQRDTLIELVKNYKDKVTGLASIDAWYYSERAKIAASAATPDLKIEMNRNLDAEKDKRTGEAMWKEFKESESYGTLFSDLESQSTATLDRLRSQLDSLKSSMSGLDPTQMKEIMDAYDKLEEAASERSPLRSLVEDLRKIKELKAQGITEESLDKTIADNDKENFALEREISAMTRMVAIKRQGGALSEDDDKFVRKNLHYYGETTEELERMITVKKSIIAANKKENAEASKTKRTYTKARKDQEKTKEVVAQLLQQLQSCTEAASEMADAMGASDTAQAVMDIVMQLISATVQVLLFAMAWKVAGVEMKAAFGIIGYILIALEAVIGIFTALFKMHDNRLQNKIEDLQEDVELLEEAYEKLKDAMDAALTTGALEKYTAATKANVQAQIADYEAMISAEEAKKKTDKDKIADWQKEIRELKDTLVELTEDEIEAAGGFGTDENIQDAAQAFADAWVDAFNEGEDALDALNDKWDEYVTNLVKKQAMLRVAGAAMEPLLKQIDEYVSEQSDGGLKLTKNELENLQAMADAVMPGLNESLKDLMDALGYSGTSTEDNLDALEQGIEGVSEETAAALESILNSMRFFLAAQQGDVAAIRTILEGRFGLAGTASSLTASTTTATTEDGSATGSNPMLTELRAQTGYLKKLSDNFEGCFTFSQQSKGKGLRVFVQ